MLVQLERADTGLEPGSPGEWQCDRLLTALFTTFTVSNTRHGWFLPGEMEDYAQSTVFISAADPFEKSGDRGQMLIVVLCGNVIDIVIDLWSTLHSNPF